MLTQSCDTLPGVGPALAAKLLKCGIQTLHDLLFHLPLRYQDRTRVTALADVRPNDWCVITGKICKTEVSTGRRRVLSCYVDDKTGILQLRFFHFNPNQLAQFRQSPLIRAFGEIKLSSNVYQMTHPEYQLIKIDEPVTVAETLTPIYPTTQGLSQSRLRQLIQLALKHCATYIATLEWMSAEQLKHHHLLAINDALAQLHNPSPDQPQSAFEDGTHPGMRRLAFDELVSKRLSFEFARRERASLHATGFAQAPQAMSALLNTLPFALTGAQQRVMQDIAHDLTRKQPMLRLVQGDVGAGKTVIAALAALQVMNHGHQVALMAPTELLSEQHANTLSAWLTPLGVNCMRLTGKTPTKLRRQVLQDIESNACQLIIGTHALFQESVTFNCLGLIMIDEQHRFGVEQRLALQDKATHSSATPHQLMLTATPIPRTLAMTQMAHLDLSIIDELPPGRTPVITTIFNQTKRDQIIQRLQQNIHAGRQVYWVCTLIDESENLDCMNATASAVLLQSQLPQARVGLLHGRMKSAEKEAIMLAFKSGELDLLVATTVIEVGVDVPNASLMIIENAERLGLSQLHQLRGRVGRGNQQSHCVLLYQPPLSSHAMERLKLLRETTDGFLIAEKDLQWRGSGQLLGKLQTGYRPFKLAQMPRDAALIQPAATLARQLLEQNPTLAQELTKRWLGHYEAFLHV